jgi:hypothetical protein
MRDDMKEQLKKLGKEEGNMLFIPYKFKSVFDDIKVIPVEYVRDDMMFVVDKDGNVLQYMHLSGDD